VRDEPASLADAYSIIKLLYREKRISKFCIVTNMCDSDAGVRLYEQLRRAVEQFLPVSLVHTANIPFDDRLAQAVRCQRPVMTAFPRCQAARSLQRLAQRVDAWETPAHASGRLEFFVERLLGTVANPPRATGLAS
jgi:flagellar biosynthesis protein FlhG